MTGDNITWEVLSKSRYLISRTPSLSMASVGMFGRVLPNLDAGDRGFTITFEELAMGIPALELQVRVCGFDFVVQIAEPNTLMPLGSTLSPSVPKYLQRAALLHCAQPLWQSLENLVGHPIELRHARVDSAAWECGESIGLRITATGPTALSTFAMIKAISPEGWRLIGHSTRRNFAVASPFDFSIDLVVHALPIPLRLSELRNLAVGDVLILDVAAKSASEVPACLKLFGSKAGLYQVVFRNMSVEIRPTAVQSTKKITRPNRYTNQDSMLSNELSKTNYPNATSADEPLDFDAVTVSIDVELGRLELPLSTLKALAVGQVFDLGQPIDGETIVLWCGDKQLGLGQLVAVGERLGVRVAVLNTNAARPTSENNDLSPVGSNAEDTGL